ncbi:hypothetical protein THAOC_21563 [Thalassiosira oceanica]|uniref:GYF domain-containing protein n=1 Tax=Thalassiosira oceanica TaxID=159749 RepID=K0SIJ6_THAOC|nr:hypothetical protein THAOC_21563 [Thalassiosira oceanica]|mmetsp:Transcript_6920/g.15911  ORF Transcript_6920/g.15911 Transcript_6920/m.15911 type:complete len:362 (+) Transcript_6920:48-1133(+)|eukprot:EJK58327.1 hypothetical protein THAOC_21563 [Thalassiosira oceanica]
MPIVHFVPRSFLTSQGVQRWLQIVPPTGVVVRRRSGETTSTRHHRARRPLAATTARSNKEGNTNKKSTVTPEICSATSSPPTPDDLQRINLMANHTRNTRSSGEKRKATCVGTSCHEDVRERIKIRKTPAITEPSYRGDTNQQGGPPPDAVKQSRDKRTVSERLAIVNDIGGHFDARAINSAASRHNIHVKTLKRWLKEAKFFRFLEGEGLGELKQVSKTIYQGKFEQDDETSMDLQVHDRPMEISGSEYATKSSVSQVEGARAVPPSSGSSWVDGTPERYGIRDTGPEQSQGRKGEAGSAPEWYYVDLQHAIQGPFERQLMRGWWMEGYLKKELPISPIRDGPFVSLIEVFPEGDAFGDS